MASSTLRPLTLCEITPINICADGLQNPLRSSAAGSHNSTGRTDQALLVHRSAKKFLTIRHVLSVAACCVRIYRAGIIPSVDSTGGTVWVVFIVV